MKKILILVLALSLLLAGEALAAAISYPAMDSNIILDSPVGFSQTRPTTKIKLVRYGKNVADAASLNSGDVVVWDMNSRDGVTISGCHVLNAVSYAGVLVTTINTPDSSAMGQGDDNWGWMATEGYCLAQVTTAQADAGDRLVPLGSGALRTFGTGALSTTIFISRDIGILLSDTGADGLQQVYLW